MRLVAFCYCPDGTHPRWPTPAVRSRVVKGWIVPTEPITPCPECGGPPLITVGACLIEEPA